ncbi:RNA polymerase factor sigma-54 [Maridesulfovibrio salexigens]|uniref:RNA polymerase, sigma 54 subunit, RpoN n=1 Tax=Maridesulfovibrio salexigens (strain ATCC 14822 / DSM 2638 / NCIMB 8403 / VKM B-1763) TaxID=526222 RepID=C6BWN1_MARSD|nr:RNA polymerase factor sigma-54 [Maridesulfovibrio salexigens]ACS80311.1 RNA polymerase, sigma 54 subunit, RpoN [Maridesulfovibrio salexigens DSM 2638]
MGLELRQQLKLTQQLVMTPQLQQAIKLLQLSRLELVDTVHQELMENPILEEAEAQERTDSPDADAGTATAEEAQISKEAEWENYLGEFSSTSKQSASRESESYEEGTSFEARLTKSASLEGHLHWQMSLSDFTEKDIAIGECLIGNLSSGGFLRIDLEDVCETCYAEIEDVEKVLHRIQRFDPVGVAARTPQECLLIQLEALKLDDDPILVSLVRDHLDDLEKKRYKPLARKFKLSMEDLKSYLDLMQTLDPLPGASFSSGDSFYVSPDAYVYEYDGDFVIVLNEDGLPKLQMNAFYVETLESTKGDDKEYFQDKMRSAQWLMKSLYQRQRTLYKVLESIVRFQREFFAHGVTKLKPLILKEVAEDIEMHESTVSRITTNKYVSTPHGIYELKFFFNSALGLDDGSQVGSESVKATIKKLIGEEDGKKPLSDEKIAEILKEKLEVNIARRTVAKYRTAMGILSSSKRKKVF